MSAGGEPTPNELATKLVDLLAPHTPFAQAIVRRQAERSGLSVATLARDELPRLVPLVVSAARVFVDPKTLAVLEAELLRA